MIKLSLLCQELFGRTGSSPVPKDTIEDYMLSTISPPLLKPSKKLPQMPQTLMQASNTTQIKKCQKKKKTQMIMLWSWSLDKFKPTKKYLLKILTRFSLLSKRLKSNRNKLKPLCQKKNKNPLLLQTLMLFLLFNQLPNQMPPKGEKDYDDFI